MLRQTGGLKRELTKHAGECPLPGTTTYDEAVRSETYGGLWHFVFHWQQDLPEALVAGREKMYIEHFYQRLTHKPDFLLRQDVQVYTAAFQQAGAMRAGFELYRAFHQDAEDNRQWVEKHGKCPIPCLWLGGEHSLLTALGSDQCSETFTGVQVETIPEAGHWVAEENPQAFVVAVLKWVQGLG